MQNRRNMEKRSFQLSIMNESTPYSGTFWHGILDKDMNNKIDSSYSASSAESAKYPIIQALNVKKTYKLGNTTINALDNVSLTIYEGEIVFVLGPSGSGKTTLLNLIGGIDSVSSGIIRVCDQELQHLSPKELTQYRKQRLSFVFQFYSLIPTLTVLENVELTMHLIKMPKAEIRRKAIEFIDMVGLKDRLNNFPSQLSGGERQRVAIARALAKDPDILLVDEPTGQLDEESGTKVVQLIRDIAKRHHKTVVLVTHDVEFVKFADRVIKLRSGKIISDEYIEHDSLGNADSEKSDNPQESYAVETGL